MVFFTLTAKLTAKRKNQAVLELRRDLRAIMEARSDYRYEAYDTPQLRQIRIPQQEWADGASLLGANGLPVAH